MHSVVYNYASPSFRNVWPKYESYETGYNPCNEDYFIMPPVRINFF
jgi:hypothetical protein